MRSPDITTAKHWFYNTFIFITVEQFRFSDHFLVTNKNTHLIKQLNRSTLPKYYLLLVMLIKSIITKAQLLNS